MYTILIYPTGSFGVCAPLFAKIVKNPIKEDKRRAQCWFSAFSNPCFGQIISMYMQVSPVCVSNVCSRTSHEEFQHIQTDLIRQPLSCDI